MADGSCCYDYQQLCKARAARVARAARAGRLGEIGGTQQASSGRPPIQCHRAALLMEAFHFIDVKKHVRYIRFKSGGFHQVSYPEYARDTPVCQVSSAESSKDKVRKSCGSCEQWMFTSNLKKVVKVLADLKVP